MLVCVSEEDLDDGAVLKVCHSVIIKGRNNIFTQMHLCLDQMILWEFTELS